MTMPDETKIEEIVEGAVEDAMTKWQRRQDADIVTLNNGASSAVSEVSALHNRVARVEEALSNHSTRMAKIETSQEESKERQDRILAALMNQPKELRKNLLTMFFFLAIIIIVANMGVF